MKRTQAQVKARVLFRLDFALRGHGAYREPSTLEELVDLVERACVRTGAPLLRYLEDREDAEKN